MDGATFPVARRSRIAFWLISLALFGGATPVRANLLFTQGVGVNSGYAAVMSTDGAQVYVKQLASVTVLLRDPVTGVLTAGPAVTTPGVGGTAITISPDGRNVYATGADAVSGASALDVFDRDATTGTLTLAQSLVEGVGGVAGIGGGVAVTVSGDGASVYVAGSSDHAIAVFSRDSTTGMLTFLETQQEGVGGVTGLQIVSDLALTPDGAHLYAVSYLDAAVAMFGRDPVTGSLSFLGVVQQGVGGVTGLTGPECLATSPDGHDLYVANPPQGIVSTFERDASTGALTEKQVLAGAGAAPAPCLQMSPDGTYLYANWGQNLNVLRRDPVTGTLSFVETQGEVRYGPFGLHGARRPVVSPDGENVYVACSVSNNVAAFRRLRVECPSTPVTTGCKEPVQARASSFSVKRAPYANSRAGWKWTKGAETLLAELGDPLGTRDDYAICVYDQRGGTQPIWRGDGPAESLCRDVHPCWRTGAGGRGLTYANSGLPPYPNNIASMTLVSGVAGHAKAGVATRPRYGSLPPLPLVTPVLVQLRSANGLCLQATYSTPSNNDASQFRAKSD